MPKPPSLGRAIFAVAIPLSCTHPTARAEPVGHPGFEDAAAIAPDDSGAPLGPTTFTTTNAFGINNAVLVMALLMVLDPTIGFDAFDLSDGPVSGWDPSVNTTTNTGFRFGGPGGTVQSGASNFSGVNRWVRDPHFVLSANPNDSWQDGLGGAATQENVSWELIFRPGDYTGTHVLFNTGGNGDGTAFVLTGNTVDFRFQDANSDSQRVIAAFDLSTLGGADLFYHVVGTADVDTAQSGTGILYVNGARVAGPITSTGTINDWDGGDVAELGTGNNIPTSTSFGPDAFTGDIALFNYYAGTVLSEAEVLQKYSDVSGPALPFVITEVTRNPDGSMQLRWNARPGQTYAVDVIEVFGGSAVWGEVVDGVGTQGPNDEYLDADATGQPLRIYRIRDESLQGPP